MINENDIILIYDGDKPYSFAQIKLKYKASNPDEYYLETILMGSFKEIICFLGRDGFFVNGESAWFEPVTIKLKRETTSGRKKLIQKNEFLLFYIDDQPAHFAQVEEIIKAEKFGYYNLTVNFFRDLVYKQTLTLRRKFIDGNEWKNLNGKMSRLEPVELNINNAELKKFRKKNHYAYLSSEGKKRQKNDIVLIYSENEAVAFARIEDISEDNRPGWYNLKLLFLQHPEMKIVTWKVKDDYINGEEFSMNKKIMRIELVEPPKES